MKKFGLIFCFLFFPSFVHAAVSEFYYSFDRPPKSLSTHHYDTASRAASYNNGVLKLTIEEGMHGAKSDKSKGAERAELIKEISFGQVNMSFKIRVGKNFKVTKRTMISQLKIMPDGYRSPIASVYLDKGGRVKCVSYTAEDQIQHIVPIEHVNITDGKWHKVLISVTPSYGSGKCSIFIDDNEVINVSDLTNIPNNSPKTFDARIGVYRDVQPFSQTVYFDDWKLESIPIKTQIQKHFEKLDLESRKKFQSNLRGYGYTSKLDGIWGNNTQIAVLKFIENNPSTMSAKPMEIVKRIAVCTRLSRNRFGCYTDAEWNEIFNDLESIFEFLNIEQRKKWQRKLRDFGYKGPIDGEWEEGMPVSMKDLINKQVHLQVKDEYGIIRQITKYLN
ncbi:polysaccharide lyase [Paracoccaceae bacterium]|nr:polysaccharide lyase [Paracoccaceae bacterium]